jgi:hypothetical protein
VTGDREEPQRVMGIPLSAFSRDPDAEEPQRVMGIPLSAFSRDPDAEEPQRVLGFPVDWFEPGRRDLRGFLERRVRGYRRWAQRRRPGA